MVEPGVPAAAYGERRLAVVGLRQRDDERLRREITLIEAALACVVTRYPSARAAADDARHCRRTGAAAAVLVGDLLEPSEVIVLSHACGARRGDAPVVAVVEAPIEEQGRRLLEAGGCDVLGSGEWKTDELVRSLRLAFEVSARLRAESRLQDEVDAGALRSEWADAARRYAGAGRLLISASHDLSNLLQPVLGHAELLVALHPADTKSGRYARMIEKAAGLAATLVRRLLMLGRTGSVPRAEVDPDRTLEMLDGLLCLLLGPKIRFDFYLGAPGVRVSLPDGALEQIVLNLVANARDAMPTGGRLALRTRRSELGWRLEAEDTGVGIEAARAEVAFDSGYTTKVQQRGAGLGLWIVRSLVEEAGGRVWIDSAPGRGARVGVELPLAGGGEPPQRAA